ncbi:MAG TPA: hypothetical protein VF701_20460 [Thermoanaerobaculia bacterium]
MRMMTVSERDTETYLYVNGLTVPHAISLSAGTELLPANWKTSRDVVEAVCDSQLDFAVASVFLPRVSSQLRVTASHGRELAIRAWNSVWDLLLLSAFFDCEAVCNFQSDLPVEQFDSAARLHVTNYHLRGLVEVRMMTNEEVNWTAANFGAARDLLDTSAFQGAVHALASYRWHSLPRAQLALLWSGIEGLFRVDTEVVFRLSLYIARFLWPDDEHARRSAFARVKQLYRGRSKAVHGGPVKDDASLVVRESAELLRTLILRSVAVRGVPDLEILAP